MQFMAGEHIMCYTEDGVRKPDVWCIENGYMALPQGKEIINGELVDVAKPEPEQPQSFKDFMIKMVEDAKAQAESKFDGMKPLMTELVKGKSADIVIGTSGLILPWTQGKYFIGDVRIWNGQPKRCVQAHDSTGNPSWDPSVASLWSPYHGTSEATALPWAAPTGAHDMYKKGEYMVWTDGSKYKCLSDTAYSPTEYPQAWEVLK